MRRDYRLSDVLHVLLHMAERSSPAASESLAHIMGTNPVVVRRTLGLLRDSGLVTAAKGQKGGWSLNCDLSEVTLRDIYQAVGAPTIFAIGNRNNSPSCLVEQVVNSAVGRSIDEAEALLMARFETVTLADLSEDFHQRFSQIRR